MPAASRKRNKGKDRKAKQLAKKEENERVDANRYWRSWCASNQWCDHGCAMTSNSHPVTSFMDQLYINLHPKGMSVQGSLHNLFETHRQIWTSESYRKIILDILIRIGTNMLLSKRWQDVMENALCVAQSIVIFEQYYDTDNMGSFVNSRAVRSKTRDLDCDASSFRRDMLKFFRKRTSCKCLKKMHLEARKTMPKVGICWNCEQEKERASLSVCSRCMITPYCSRECQIEAWPGHEEKCDIYFANAHKKIAETIQH